MIEYLPSIRSCGDFVVRRGWKEGPRTIHDHELIYFPMGTLTTFRISDQKFTLNQPIWVIIRGGSEHSFHFDETSVTHQLFVHFSGGECYAPTLLAPQGPYIIPSSEADLPSMLISHLLLIAHTKKDLHRCNIVLSTILSDLEHTYHENNGRLSKEQISEKPQKGITANTIYPPIISEALVYIRNRLVEPITVAEIAAHCQISHEHLTRTFVRTIGLPPRQVIIELRIEHAAHLLLHSKLNIKEIALQCGFSENHYFSRVFAKSYGMTATAYRKEYANPHIQHVDPNGLFETIYRMNTYVDFT